MKKPPRTKAEINAYRRGRRAAADDAWRKADQRMAKIIGDTHIKADAAGYETGYRQALREVRRISVAANAAVDRLCAKYKLDPNSWMNLYAKRDEVIANATKILIDGLKYFEHDGHNMPKKVAREALEAVGVSREEQP